MKCHKMTSRGFFFWAYREINVLGSRKRYIYVRRRFCESPCRVVDVGMACVPAKEKKVLVGFAKDVFCFVSFFFFCVQNGCFGIKE